MARRFVVAAAGTGGHIIPGIQIGRELQRSGLVDVEYLCGPRPIEQQVYGGERVTPTRLRTGGARGSLAKVMQPLEFTADFAKLLATFVVRRPAGVLAMGGAACFPTLAAAVALRVPIFLHESNRIPGRVIRLFRRHARTVFLGLGGLDSPNVEIVGTPVRWRETLPDSDRRVVLCVGGSQGAGALNNAFIGAATRLQANFPALRFVLISGPGKRTADAPAWLDVREYEADLPSLLAQTILAVSRAGAGSLADLANHRVPSILVPYPHAMDDHQRANAICYSDRGAATLLEERDLTPITLASAMEALLVEPGTPRLRMAEALAHFDSRTSASFIAQRILTQLDLLSPAPAPSASSSAPAPPTPQGVPS
jgi:UDP-N-acetylglucosamine--N-acetylmuramyl-(pentapeptide) pyrophosphoryl-undecaprenol N-acetylglucosamine transferase